MLGVVPTLGETVARSHKVEKQRICTLALLLLALLLRSFGLSLAIGIFLCFFCLEAFFVLWSQFCYCLYIMTMQEQAHNASANIGGLLSIG
jgi:hypothetical protein